jgi:hypothetical protein
MALIESSKVTKTLRNGAAQTLLFLLCRAHPRGSGRVLPGSPPATSPGNSCTPAGPFQRRILRALARQSRTEWRGRAKVSNELSNYRGANRQPCLDDPGSFGAAALGIDDHPACFTTRGHSRGPVGQMRPLPVCPSSEFFAGSWGPLGRASRHGAAGCADVCSASRPY